MNRSTFTMRMTRPKTEGADLREVDMSASSQAPPSGAPLVVNIVGGGLDRHAAEALGIELIRLARRYGVEPSRVHAHKEAGGPEARLGKIEYVKQENKDGEKA